MESGINNIHETISDDQKPSISETFIENSKSVCPKCLKIIDCEIISVDNNVYLRKRCQDHGSFEVMIYSDAEAYLNAAKYNKPGAKPLHYQGTVSSGCPDDCGLCPEHQQHTCIGIIELTDKCNLNCPVCFANVNGSYSLPYNSVKEMIDLYVKCEGEPEVLQISGGEPTIHPDIIRILEYAGKKGIKYPMLNTNGLKLADRKFAEQLSKTMIDHDSPIGTPLIYLQFDGFDDKIYTELRGRPLLDQKLKALENCRIYGMNITLVPTIVKGINDDQIGKIIELALSDSNIKMVNFQPATLIGRYDLNEKENNRITIPEILSAVEKQTDGLLNHNSFINVPCPYPTCSVCTYIYKLDEKSLVLTDLFDIDNYIEHMVNRTLPDLEILSEVNSALDSLLSMSSTMSSEKTGGALCTTCGIAIPNIKEMIDNITIISAHAFMDEYNFDLKRAKKCCVTEILPNGQMIPFCVYNILKRQELTPTFQEYFGREHET
jgi:uncharacterized radical SAM superfamily Fe-S cluster-containing enzyme